MRGTIRLFRIAGIEVFLSWSWFLVAAYEMQQGNRYSSFVWSALEYVALFVIVMLHEFGHALACRQVGGIAKQIILWPLGGVAYVNPPARPGATLWSIAAGPLVNVALMPVLGLAYLGTRASSTTPSSDFISLVIALNIINLGLFLFNVLPIYPLDGGKILRSLLWYAVGRARSLMVAVIVGFIGVAGLVLLAIGIHSIWLVIISVYAGMQCAEGYKQARALKRLAAMPRREEFACPSCNANPPQGALWACAACRTAFDTFEANAICPRCGAQFPKTVCPDCGVFSPHAEWTPATQSESFGLEKIKPPSIVPIVLGVTACLAALLIFLVGVLFLKVSSDTLTRRIGYRAEIDKLWLSEGMTIPGEQVFDFQRVEQYDAYIETIGAATLKKNDDIEIAIVAADSGELVPVTNLHHSIADSFQRNGHTLFPKATFRVSRFGRYTVHASSLSSKAVDARIKIGPSFGLVTGDTASLEWGTAVGAFVLALFVLALGVLFFYIYGRRRKEFNLTLQKGTR